MAGQTTIILSWSGSVLLLQLHCLVVPASTLSYPQENFIQTLAPSINWNGRETVTV